MPITMEQLDTEAAIREVLSTHLEPKPAECVVQKWQNSQPFSNREMLNKIRALNMDEDKKKHTDIAELYKALTSETALPFKVTSFRSHMRGYCVCQ